jgi:hypothetical protein
MLIATAELDGRRPAQELPYIGVPESGHKIDIGVHPDCHLQASTRSPQSASPILRSNGPHRGSSCNGARNRSLARSGIPESRCA